MVAGRDSRLFHKILLYFLSLLIPIIVIGTATYLHSSSMMKKDFNERIAMNLQNAAETVDLYLKTAQETGVNFFSDLTVQTLLVPEERQTLVIRSELWKLPRILQRSETLIGEYTDKLFVYVDDRRVYTSGGVDPFALFFDSFYHYRSLSPADWAGRLKNARSIEVLNAAETVQKGNNVSKRVIPIVISGRVQNRSAVMVVNIAAEAMERTLRGNAVFDSSVFLVTDLNHRAMIDGQGFLQDEETARTLAGLSGTDERTAEMLIGGKQHVVTHTQSDLFGWNYYSVTPAGEFRKHTSGTLLMTALLCVVFLIMGVLFSIIFSVSIYSPIRNIREIVSQSRERLLADASAAEPVRNEYEWIEEGISKIADSQRQYKEKYDRHTSEYVEYSILFLLKGHTLNQEEILRDTLAGEFGFNRKGFVCCALFFEFKGSFYDDIQDTERLYVMSGIKKIIWATLNKRLPAYVLEYRRNLFVGVVNLEQPQEAGLLEQAFQTMHGIFEYDLNRYYEIMIGIGEYYENVNDLRNSFNEAMTALGKRNKAKQFQIVKATDLEIENSFVYSFFEEQKILNYLKTSDVAGLHAALDEIVDANVGRGISYEHIRMLFKELYFTGIRFLAEKGLSLKQLELQDSFGIFQDADNGKAFAGVKELKAFIADFYGTLLAAAGAQSGQKSGNLVSMIVKYIQDHYTQDLGLEQIADEMGVSVKYVSRIFKDKTGVYLTDFINQIRIDKAKELLVHTDMRVNDIAGSIGINSRTTFLRVFKKVEGVSPNEYRLLHRRSPAP